MRLAPVVLRYYPDLDEVLKFARLSSQTTHGAAEAIECCAVLAEIITHALTGEQRKDRVLAATRASPASASVQGIAAGTYLTKDRDQVRGTGYSVQSLEAALWCFVTTDSFEDAVLAAANLGDDADTTAAITGQVAGAFYGVDAIPGRWRQQLFMGDELEAMAVGLMARDGRPVPF